MLGRPLAPLFTILFFINKKRGGRLAPLLLFFFFYKKKAGLAPLLLFFFFIKKKRGLPRFYYFFFYKKKAGLAPLLLFFFFIKKKRGLSCLSRVQSTMEANAKGHKIVAIMMVVALVKMFVLVEIHPPANLFITIILKKNSILNCISLHLSLKMCHFKAGMERNSLVPVGYECLKQGLYRFF